MDSGDQGRAHRFPIGRRHVARLRNRRFWRSTVDNVAICGEKYSKSEVSQATQAVGQVVTRQRGECRLAAG